MERYVVLVYADRYSKVSDGVYAYAGYKLHVSDFATLDMANAACDVLSSAGVDFKLIDNVMDDVLYDCVVNHGSR